MRDCLNNLRVDLEEDAETTPPSLVQPGRDNFQRGLTSAEGKQTHPDRSKDVQVSSEQIAQALLSEHLRTLTDGSGHHACGGGGSLDSSQWEFAVKNATGRIEQRASDSLCAQASCFKRNYETGKMVQDGDCFIAWEAVWAYVEWSGDEDDPVWLVRTVRRGMSDKRLSLEPLTGNFAQAIRGEGSGVILRGQLIQTWAGASLPPGIRVPGALNWFVPGDVVFMDMAGKRDADKRVAHWPWHRRQILLEDYMTGIYSSWVNDAQTASVDSPPDPARARILGNTTPGLLVLRLAPRPVLTTVANTLKLLNAQKVIADFSGRYQQQAYTRHVVVWGGLTLKLAAVGLFIANPDIPCIDSSGYLLLGCFTPADRARELANRRANPEANIEFPPVLFQTFSTWSYLVNVSSICQLPSSPSPAEDDYDFRHDTRGGAVEYPSPPNMFKSISVSKEEANPFSPSSSSGESDPVPMYPGQLRWRLDLRWETDMGQHLAQNEFIRFEQLPKKALYTPPIEANLAQSQQLLEKVGKGLVFAVVSASDTHTQREQSRPTDERWKQADVQPTESTSHQPLYFGPNSFSSYNCAPGGTPAGTTSLTNLGVSPSNVAKPSQARFWCQYLVDEGCGEIVGVTKSQRTQSARLSFPEFVCLFLIRLGADSKLSLNVTTSELKEGLKIGRTIKKNSNQEIRNSFPPSRRDAKKSNESTTKRGVVANNKKSRKTQRSPPVHRTQQGKKRRLSDIQVNTQRGKPKPRNETASNRQDDNQPTNQS